MPYSRITMLEDLADEPLEKQIENPSKSINFQKFIRGSNNNTFVPESGMNNKKINNQQHHEHNMNQNHPQEQHNMNHGHNMNHNSHLQENNMNSNSHLQETNMYYNYPTQEHINQNSHYQEHTNHRSPYQYPYNQYQELMNISNDSSCKFTQEENNTGNRVIPSEKKQYVLSCIDISDHVKSCRVCSKLYNNDKILYIIIICVLCIIILLLLKKVLDI